MIRRTLPILLGIACAGIARADMPPELVEMLAKPEVPATARTELEAGGAPVWVLERDTSAEQISVAGVVKISGSPQRVAEDFFRRDSLLEADLLKASGTFSEPAVLGDVAKYHVPESDLEVLADCEIHACKFKLGARALEELGAIDWDSPDARRNVDALVQRRIVEFVAAYQKEGRAAFGRYLDKPDARSVPEATGMLLDQMKAALARGDGPHPSRAATRRLGSRVRATACTGTFAIMATGPSPASSTRWHSTPERASPPG